MNRRGPEALRAAMTPNMVRLVELHHPSWNANRVELAATKLVDATDMLVRKLSYIPQRNPAKVARETRRAIRQFGRNLNLINSTTP